MSYSTFAFYYDALTGNVDYRARADYLCRLLERLGHAPGITLDLACGTGSLTLELARRGLDVYGVDGSLEMLSVAKQKASEAGLDVLFLCQRMQSIDLYGTVDTAFLRSLLPAEIAIYSKGIIPIGASLTAKTEKRIFRRMRLPCPTPTYHRFC